MNNRLIIPFLFLVFFGAHALTCDYGYGQVFPLESQKGLELINVKVEEVVYEGAKAIRATRIKPQEESLAIMSGVDFENGTIEVELSGKPLASAGAGARGFVGMVFRLNLTDPLSYECFYLRPTNPRSEDQLRRNHSTQYVSHPEYTWFKLRNETPGKYESYVDMVPGEWIKVKIVVKDQDARLFVHGAEQPNLIVKDLKQKEQKGAVALWIGPGTEAHFRNLVITPN